MRIPYITEYVNNDSCILAISPSKLKFWFGSPTFFDRYMYYGKYVDENTIRYDQHFICQPLGKDFFHNHKDLKIFYFDKKYYNKIIGNIKTLKDAKKILEFFEEKF